MLIQVSATSKEIGIKELTKTFRNYLLLFKVALLLSPYTVQNNFLEDYGDYGNYANMDYEFPKWTPETYLHIEYGIILVISFALIFIQFYVSIGGQRMRLHAFRWVTIHLSGWNIFQLVLNFKS